jgi:hypothetical protein
MKMEVSDNVVNINWIIENEMILRYIHTIWIVW